MIRLNIAPHTPIQLIYLRPSVSALIQAPSIDSWWCCASQRTISQWTIYWFLACLLLSLLAVPQHRKWDPLIISNKCCLFIATDHIRPSSVSLRLAEETWTTRPCAPARVSNFLRNRWINRRAAETPSNGKINKHPSRNRWSMNLVILELS